MADATTQEDERRRLAKDAYDRSPVTMNARQAEALAGLLWDGEMRGTVYPNVEPLRTAAVYGMGDRAGMDFELAEDRRTGERLPDPENPDHVRMDPGDPPSCTLLVIAADGRTYQIVRAGIVWPYPRPEESPT